MEKHTIKGWLQLARPPVNARKYEKIEFEESVKAAIEAVEKQIPKKPVLEEKSATMNMNMGSHPHEFISMKWIRWNCPVCYGFVGERVMMPWRNRTHDQRKKKFCEECGQRIDWEVEE